MRLPLISCISVVFFLISCSSGKHVSDSGRPEIHVQATPKAVLTRIVEWAPTVGQLVTRADTNLWFVTTIQKMDAFLNDSLQPLNVDATTVYTIVPMTDFVAINEQRRISYFNMEKDKDGNINSVHHYEEYKTPRAFDEMQAELAKIASNLK